MTKITIDDVRAAGFCVSGARGWFRQHGIPFNDFLKNGIEAGDLIARGDHLAVEVVERKRQRESASG